MNPAPGRNVLIHPLARMLPLHRYQSQAYLLAQKYPPGFEDGFTPIWEVVSFSLAARATAQVRVNFQRDFHLIALAGSSSQAGGFRAQFYDQKKRRRLADRGINFANYMGPGSSPLFLREPYPLTEPNAQVLVIVQNQDTGGANNLIQIALYGQARRFNYPS